MECEKCKETGELLKAAKVIENKFFVKKQHISAVEMVPLVEAIAKAERKEKHGS